jgi:hypothetical protein
MIARKQNADVFVLGEEALAGPMPVGEVESARAKRESGSRKRRTRARLDPFRIDVHGLEGVATSAGSRRPDRAARVGQTRPELRTWLRPGGVALAALVAVAAVGSMDSARLLGGSERETANSPTAETPVSIQPPPRVQAPARTNLKRDSRPRPTRGREGRTPRPQASSRGRPAAATPSTPAVATPSPPSQGGASGGRDNFGFEG